MNPQLVQLFEVGWVITALVGLGISAATWWEARSDERYLFASGKNGPRRIVAQGAVRRARIQMLTLAIYAFLGIVLLVRPLLEGRFSETTVGIATLGAFCFAVVQITVGSLMDRRNRRALLVSIGQGRR